MKAVVYLKPGEVQLQDRPLPIPGKGEVRLRVDLAGLCSTDRHIFQGHFPVPAPRVLGHELVGTVEAAGPGVDPGWLGQACGVAPARFCGACPSCRRGFPELCANFECLGNTHDGGFAGQVVVKTGQLVPLDGLAPEAGVWLEPLACVIHALRLAWKGPEDRLLVIGAGVLGRLMILAGTALLDTPMAVADPNPGKVQSALACGAQAGWVVPRVGEAVELEAALPAWAETGPQAVIDTSGATAALERALRWAAPGGRVILFGVAEPEARVCLPPALLFQKEVSLRAAAGMTPAAFQEAEALLRSGRLDPTPLVSAVVGLEEVPGRLAGVRPPESALPLGSGKVLVRPAEDSAGPGRSGA